MNGLKSFFDDGLDVILIEFDESSGKPKNFKKVLHWPVCRFEAKQGLESQNKFDFAKSFDLLKADKSPILSESSAKKWKKSLNNTVEKKCFEDISNECLASVVIMVSFLLEIIKGNLTEAHCLKSLMYGPNVSEHPCGDEVLFDTDNFSISILTQFKVERVNLFKQQVEHFKKDSIEYYLWRLKLVQNFSKLNDKQLEKHLHRLSHLYDIDNSSGQNFVIKSSSRGKFVRLPKIKSMLERILSIDANLKCFLENSSETITNKTWVLNLSRY